MSLPTAVLRQMEVPSRHVAAMRWALVDENGQRATGEVLVYGKDAMAKATNFPHVTRDGVEWWYVAPTSQDVLRPVAMEIECASLTEIDDAPAIEALTRGRAQPAHVALVKPEYELVGHYDPILHDPSTRLLGCATPPDTEVKTAFAAVQLAVARGTLLGPVWFWSTGYAPNVFPGGAQRGSRFEMRAVMRGTIEYPDAYWFRERRPTSIVTPYEPSLPGGASGTL